MMPGLEELWMRTRGDRRVRIALLDGPVDLSHPCFADAQIDVVGGAVSSEATGGAAMRHGTQVASVLFGGHASAIRGIAPQCHGLLIPIFLDEPGRTGTSCTQLELARAIRSALEHDAHIINISGGQFDDSGEPDPWLSDAIRACDERGVVIVSAAGNDGCACEHLPAAAPSVLAVGALGVDGRPLKASNWGSAYRSQGILALGERITTALPGGGSTPASGTSFATPMTAGVAALLMALQLEVSGKVDGRAVREALLATSTPCPHDDEAACERFLAGSLNIPAAVKMIIGNAIAPNTTRSSNSTAPSGIPLKGRVPLTPQEVFVPINIRGSIRDLHTSSFPINHQTMKDHLDATLAPSTLEGELDMPGDHRSTLVDPVMVAPSATEPTSTGVVPTSALLTPASCDTCGGGVKGPEFVFALGELGHDLGNEARHDAFRQAGLRDPSSPVAFLDYADRSPYVAESVMWTLNQYNTAIYVVHPVGAFAHQTYELLRELYRDQLEGAERVSIPGRIAGTTRLMSGQTVPVIVPDQRGMSSWSTKALVNAVAGGNSKKGAKGASKQETDRKTAAVTNFLDRVYYDMRNFGRSPQERALNYAATNAFQAERIFESALNDGMELANTSVERSPICRPGSDCWDVKILFFDPLQRDRRANRAYRFTVDVSDVLPITVGPVRTWSEY